MVFYEPIYTVKEASAVLKINVNDIYDLINDGLLKAIRVTNHSYLKVRGCDLEDYINKCVPAGEGESNTK